MKTIIQFFTFAIILFSFTGIGIAQPEFMRGGPPQHNRPERLEKFRKMRLIEELKLNEDDAVRFFAKQGTHEDKVQELMTERNSVLDDMEALINPKGDVKDLQGMTDKVLDIDKKIYTERQRFQDDVRKFLSPIQFARFLTFERNFGREVRKAMMDMRRGNRREDQDEGERP